MRLLHIFLGMFLLLNGASLAEKRVALIIGNGAYTNTTALKNPLNDASDMENKLKTLGFEVISGMNLDKRGIEERLALFGRAVIDADVALFFYAGHGMQYGGQNYLMPVDAKLQDEFSLKFEMTRMDDVMTSINSTKGVKIVMLDACRDNPLSEKLSRSATRSIVGRGLAPIDKIQGTIVVYATQAQTVAQDGTGRNSPFTTAFLKHVDKEELEVGRFFRLVSKDVNEATKGTQMPEISISILGDFHFKKGEDDKSAWDKIKASTNEKDLTAFKNKFPDSPFSEIVVERLGAADRKKTAIANERQELLQKEQLALKAEEERIAKRKIELAALQEPPKQEIPKTSPTLLVDIKAELLRHGCYKGVIDDSVFSPELSQAMTTYSGLKKIKVSSIKLDQPLLESLKGEKDRLCPLKCLVIQEEKDNACVAKTCDAGLKLNAKGECFKPVVKAFVEDEDDDEPVVRAKPKPKAAAPKAGGGCITGSDGRKYC
jgi:Caspase domain